MKLKDFLKKKLPDLYGSLSPYSTGQPALDSKRANSDRHAFPHRVAFTQTPEMATWRLETPWRPG